MRNLDQDPWKTATFMIVYDFKELSMLFSLANAQFVATRISKYIVNLVFNPNETLNAEFSRNTVIGFDLELRPYIWPYV